MGPLTTLTLQFSAVLLTLLALRPVFRRAFGATCVYAMWALVPLLIAAANAPASRPGLVLHQLVADELAAAAIPTMSPPPPGLSWLLLTWAAGALMALAMLAWQQHRFMRGLRWDAARACWRGQAGDGPALIGVLRPRLMLPLDFEARFTPRQRRLILAHEATHAARLDNVWNLLAALSCALQWFNPLAWWGLRALRIDQELACDAAVLRTHPGQQQDYADALIRAQGMASAGLIWSSWRSHHPLVERIAMLKTHSLARRRAGLLTLALVGALAGGAVHASRTAASQDTVAGTVMLSLSITASDLDNGKAMRLRTSPKLLVALGQMAAVTIGESSHRIALQLTPTRVADGSYRVTTQVSRGTPPVSLAQTDLKVREGELTTFDSGLDSEGRNVLLVLTAAARAPEAVIKQPQ